MSKKSEATSQIRFRAALVARGPRKAWTFLYLPEDASAALGSRGMVAVRGTMNGRPFRTSAQPSGTGTHKLAVNKKLQASAGVSSGDTVEVVLELDTDALKVAVPRDLQRALRKSPRAVRLWDAITPRARREWVEWVDSAKKEETRKRRIAKVVDRLAAGKRRVYD